MSRTVRIPQTASLKPTGSGVETSSGSALQVFVCNDDLNEQLMFVLAAEEANIAIEFTFVDSGDELMMLLSHRIEFGGIPDLIIIDLDKDGRQLLAQLQMHPSLWQIPVLALTNMDAGNGTVPHSITDAHWCEMRPNSFDALVELMEGLATRAFHSGYTIALNEIDLAGSKPTINLSITSLT